MMNIHERLSLKFQIHSNCKYKTVMGGSSSKGQPLNDWKQSHFNIKLSCFGCFDRKMVVFIVKQTWQGITMFYIFKCLCQYFLFTMGNLLK